MPTRVRIFLLLLLVVAGCADPGPPLPWQTLTFGDRFAVDLPGEAAPTVTTGSGPWGTSTTYTYVVEPPGRGLKFRLSYYDKTDEAIQKAGGLETYFENVELMQHAPSGGKKAGYNREDITVALHPGREYQIEDTREDGAVMHLRVVGVRYGPGMATTRIVALRVTGPNSRRGTPEVRRFFDSFRVP